MRRTTSRSHILYPGLLLLAFLMFFVPEAHVEMLRARAVSALSPVLRVTGQASRHDQPKPALIRAVPLGEIVKPQPAAAEATATAQQPRVDPTELDLALARNVLLEQEINKLNRALSKNAPAANLQIPAGTPAQVIGKKILWQEPILALDRGEADGVRLNAGVLYRGAVVGRIISIGPRASTMALLTHRGLSIAARLSECRAEGVLHGKPPTGDETAERLCTLAVVGRELNTKVGEQVVTSGFDGTFPAGLLLGTVTGTKKISDMQWEVSVRPACDENVIECVQIITVAAPEVPWPNAPVVKKK